MSAAILVRWPSELSAPPGHLPDRRAPRETPVRCPLHDRRHPVSTFNRSGLCDEHDQGRTA